MNLPLISSTMTQFAYESRAELQSGLRYAQLRLQFCCVLQKGQSIKHKIQPTALSPTKNL